MGDVSINYCRSLRPDALAGATALTRLEATRLSELQLGLLDGLRTRLRALKLHRCPIDDHALRLMPHVDRLSVAFAPAHFRGTHIGAMTGLRNVKLLGCGGLSDMRLGACASLTALSVSLCGVPPAGMADVMPRLQASELAEMSNVDDTMLGAATGLTRLELSKVEGIDGSCFECMQRLWELKLQEMDGLSGCCLAPLAGSLLELDARNSALDEEGVGALTGLRRLTLDRCRGVSMDAVRQMPMLRHLDVTVLRKDRSATAESWRRVRGREGAAALRAEMPQLEHVRVAS